MRSKTRFFFSGSRGQKLKKKIIKKIPVELHVFYGHSTWWTRKQQQWKWKKKWVSPALTQQFPESSQWGWMTGSDRNRGEHILKSFQKGDRPSCQHCVGLCTWVLRDFCFPKMMQGSSPQSKTGYTYFQGSVFIHCSNYCSSQCTAFTFCSIRKTTRCEWWGTDFPEHQLSSSWPHILKASCWSQVCMAHWPPLSRLIYLISSRGTHSSEGKYLNTSFSSTSCN